MTNDTSKIYGSEEYNYDPDRGCCWVLMLEDIKLSSVAVGRCCWHESRYVTFDRRPKISPNLSERTRPRLVLTSWCGGVINFD
ncbi:MAG: hypothetical protein L7S47_02245 [Acidimicrobiales bacterium]|nr:hypothetical protein [Acidimicrobiales bacterium]